MREWSPAQSKMENRVTFPFVLLFDSLSDGVRLTTKGIQGCKCLPVLPLWWITHFQLTRNIRKKTKTSVMPRDDNRSGALMEGHHNRRKLSCARHALFTAKLRWLEKPGQAYPQTLRNVCSVERGMTEGWLHASKACQGCRVNVVLSPLSSKSKTHGVWVWWWWGLNRFWLIRSEICCFFCPSDSAQAGRYIPVKMGLTACLFYSYDHCPHSIPIPFQGTKKRMERFRNHYNSGVATSQHCYSCLLNVAERVFCFSHCFSCS